MLSKIFIPTFVLQPVFALYTSPLLPPSLSSVCDVQFLEATVTLDCIFDMSRVYGREVDLNSCVINTQGELGYARKYVSVPNSRTS
jgi:hypothetical protein